MHPGGAYGGPQHATRSSGAKWIIVLVAIAVVVVTAAAIGVGVWLNLEEEPPGATSPP